MAENKNDLTILLKVNQKPVAEEVQRLLNEGGIHCLLKSDNAASSALNMYVGNHVIETITIWVTEEAYLKAAHLLEDTPYFDLLANND